MSLHGYNRDVNDGERSALTTACDDLQAQLEAGDRSMRHLDQDLSSLHEALQAAFVHAEKIGDLQRHMRELRANMREQRQALGEVRRAARALCASMTRTRESVASLVDEKVALDANHDMVAADHGAGKPHADQTERFDYETRPLASRMTKRDPAT